MDRLTEWTGLGAIALKYQENFDMSEETFAEYQKVLDKLAHYEDLEEAARLVELPCALGDTIYDLCKCDDGEYRIFLMVVVDINAYGALRRVKDREPSVYNIYAESDYTYMFASFYDIGRTIFMTREEAEAALKERESEWTF